MLYKQPCTEKNEMQAVSMLKQRDLKKGRRGVQIKNEDNPTLLDERTSKLIFPRSPV